MVCRFQLVRALVLTACVIGAYPSVATGISGVIARQRYPWNGKVDIAYTVEGNVAAAAAASDCFPVLQVSALDKVTGKKYVATRLSGDQSLTEGEHLLTWDMDAEKCGLESDRVVFTVACIVNPLYCIIDISSGTKSTFYPVSYLQSEPEGGFNVDAYKTNCIVMKLIEPGSFIMGSEKANEEHLTRISKPFFIGIFEITQAQLKLISGSNPSEFGSSLYPVDSIPYTDIRGSSLGAKWPETSEVDTNSVIGVLRARSGLNLDLPTNAQWEYACRAGTETVYSYGDTADPDYMWYDQKGGFTSLPVGQKLPNAWGLYDMHGNACEWCLDWCGTLSYGTDPRGPSTGTQRSTRGGSWYRSAEMATSAYIYALEPSKHHNETGFRLLLNAPE